MAFLKRLAWATSLLTITTAQTQYGENQVPVKRDNDAVAANFPSVDGISLFSPAFQSLNTVRPGFANGTDGPTTHFELDYFVQSLASRNSDWMTYRSADFSSEEGRSFPYVFLSTSASNGTSASSSSGKLRAWLQGGVHGNEPAGDQSLLALLGKMDANQTWTASLLERMDIVILFRYNPDGVEYFQRTLATNLDPNRDHIKLMRQQTRDIKELFNAFQPHVAADMHEFGANYAYGPEGNLVQGADALFSAAKNLNIHPNIRNLSEKLFAAQIGEDLEDAGFRWEPYATSDSEGDEPLVFDEAGSDPRIGRNAMGMTQSVTFLFEMRGIGIADQEFQRRTACGLTMATSLLQIAADNAELVYNTISASVEDFVSGSEDIVVTDYTERSERTWTMVDGNNGSLIQQPIQFASTTPTTANLTRSRPQAYLIPRAWSDIAARLETFGLEVQRLEYGYSGPVQALNITSSVLADEYYEGLVLAEVTAREVVKEVSLPPGSYWVSTAQKNTALAFVALEPENIDSFVTYGIIALEAGDEYPIFRVIE